MDKYLKAIERMNRIFGEEWRKPAMEAIRTVALEDFFDDVITKAEYEEICQLTGLRGNAF